MFRNNKAKDTFHFALLGIWLPTLFFLFSSQSIKTGAAKILFEEVCDNAIDDDNDGLIDINDPDCHCEIVRQESLVPNPSFEDYLCCPNDASQMNCVNGWQQASGATTDYLNQCGYVSIPTLSPFPDGDGAIAFIAGSIEDANGSEIHKEYAGVCLNYPMEKDVVYEFTFYIGFLDEVNSPPINFTFFGSPTCSNLPFTAGFDCPTNYPDWYLLDSQVFSIDQAPGWKEVSMTIQPNLDINAIVIGDDCYPKGGLKVYLLDNLILKNEASLDFELLEIGSPCDPDFAFAVEGKSNFQYQWYREGIALIGENQSELSQMHGEGTYQLRIIDTESGKCRISEDIVFSIPVVEHEIFETLCSGESISFGTDLIGEAGSYQNTFSTAEGCDSIVTLHVEVQAEISDTLYAQILPGSTYEIDGQDFAREGEHRVNLLSSVGCDSTVVLFLELTDVYIPNAFSPNGDNFNDYFEVYAGSNTYQEVEMQIFDRWGNLVFKGERWDGMFQHKEANPGVYVYVVRFVGLDGRVATRSSSLTLMR